MDVDGLWTYDDLERLNVLVQPVWVYSCQQQELLWANSAAVQLVDQPAVDAPKHPTAFAPWVPDKERSGFLTLNNLLLDEVEVSGLELTLPGFGRSVLPGVPPHAALASSIFIYKPLRLVSRECGRPSRYTLVQVAASGGGHSGSKMVAVKVPRQTSASFGPTSSERFMNGMCAASSSASLVSTLLDLFQDIITGREVALDSVVSLQTSLLKGDIISTPGRIEEELLHKEALDQDVGLNLLQLLGSHTEMAGRGDDAPYDSSDLHAHGRDSGTLAPLECLQQHLPLQHSPTRASGSSSHSYGHSHAAEERMSSGRVRLGPSGGGGTSMSMGGGTGSSTVGGGGGCSGPGAAAADGEHMVVTSLMMMAPTMEAVMPAMEAVLATVENWRFDAFKLAEVTQGHPLSALGFWLMKRYDIIHTFDLDATKLARFLRRVEDGYPDNPYHNKTHAAHVLQGMHVLLTRGGLQRRLGEELAAFAGYMAAILHDYEHRGLNNDFLVRVGDELALTYNDMAPMENHHVASSFKLLRHKDFNFMRKMRREKWVRLRRLLIDAVLATDMKQHFNVLSKFQAKLQVKLRGSGFASASHGSSGAPSAGGGSGAPDSPLVRSIHAAAAAAAAAAGDDAACALSSSSPLLLEDDADKSLVLQVALKIADVGHLAAPWDVHHRWVTGLEEEFFRQGDKEKTMHMLVSPLMDRTKDGITKSQVGFFDIVALPLFYAWCAVFNNCSPLLRAVEDNCNRWRVSEAERAHSASVERLSK